MVLNGSRVGVHVMKHTSWLSDYSSGSGEHEHQLLKHIPSKCCGLVECEPSLTASVRGGSRGGIHAVIPSDGWGTLQLLGTGATND